MVHLFTQMDPDSADEWHEKRDLPHRRRLPSGGFSKGI